MKKQLLKTAAFFLALVMAAGFIPARNAYAFPIPQPATRLPVSEITIAPQPEPGIETGQGPYAIEFIWTQPNAGPSDNRGAGGNAATLGVHGGDPETGDPNATWTRYASRYIFNFANRTLGTTFPEVVLRRTDVGVQERANAAAPWGAVTPYGVGNELPPGHQLRWQTTRAFQTSSFYEISIEPQHFTPIWIPPVLVDGTIQSGTNVWTYDIANWGSAANNQSTPMIFMSDIELVRADGGGGEIVIEWLNPLWNGANVFDNWNITVLNAITGGNVLSRPILDPANDIEVLDGGRRLRYTIVSNNLQIGGSYHVRIEPMIGTQNARTLSSITMPGDARTFFFAYRASGQFPYQTETPVLMIPTLNLVQEGENFIRLLWDRMAAAAVGRIEIEQWADANEPNPSPDVNDITAMGRRTVIASIPAPQATVITQWPVGIINPPRPMAWSIVVFDTNNVPLARSNIVHWRPGEAHFTPYAPELEPIVGRTIAGTGSFDLVWRAFTRPAYTDAEEALLNTPPHSDFNNVLVDHEDYRRHFIDDEIRFHIFVANTWADLQNMPLDNPTINIPANLGMLIPAANSPVEGVPFYRMEGISVFSRPDGAGGFTHNHAVQPNETYFIRIIAMRDRVGLDALPSRPSYGTVVIPPPEDGIITRPEMIAAPPFTGSANGAGQPPELFLEWPLRFLEIYDTSATSPEGRGWYASAGIRNGDLAFGRRAGRLADVERWRVLNQMLSTENRRVLEADREGNPLNTAASVNTFLQSAWTDISSHLGYTGTTASAGALRIQDLYLYSYQIHVVTYDELMTFGADIETAFENYRDQMVASDWSVPFRPTPDDNGIMRHRFTNMIAAGAIQPNTTYVVLMRPVESRNYGLHAFYPSYTIITTPDDSEAATPTPTTPVLFPHVPIGMDHITVRWRRQSGIQYELRWSENLSDYPTGGTLIAWEDIEGEYVLYPDPTAGPFMALTIDGLFLDTRHYVWARAVNADDVTSGWSNPVDMRTLDISPPAPPITLGLAGQNLLDRYNRENDGEYRSVEAEAITVSWSRIIADMRNGDEKATGGSATGGTAVDLDIPGLENIYVVRFSELQANRDFYVRARTVLTVQRGAPGETEMTYSYIVQLADNPDFLDAITFEIPALEPVDSNNMRRAYSDWVTIETRTAPSDDEFDGAYRPDQFPLPDRDFEVTYTPGSQTLQWRFRTNQIGADGRPDQNVDQRFISRLITERTFIYTIDMSQYHINPTVPISNREIIVPLSIIRAFNERQITLEVNAGDLIYRILPGAFDTAEMRNLQMGTGSYVHMTMTSNPTDMPTLGTNLAHAMPPQRLAVRAQTPQRNVTMTTFARPIEIILPMDNHVSPAGTTAALFHSGAGVQGWQDMNGHFSFANNQLTATVSSPGTFSGVTRHAPPTQGTGGTTTAPVANPALTGVTSRLNITDLHTFNPNQGVSANAFNNIIHAVAHRQTTATMGGTLTPAQTQALQRSNLLAPNVLIRETAIDILVRLYGLQTGQVLTPMTAETSIPGIGNASQELRRNIRIGADIGFISGPLDPQGNLTMGDLMHMLNILMIDAGW
ncbi:MAG: hypothetical protein FWE05_07055 [Defluviitaleaceae bacterium]|nr:hypothetical protein [Defluviitaleaceae bacterium]